MNFHGLLLAVSITVCGLMPCSSKAEPPAHFSGKIRASVAAAGDTLHGTSGIPSNDTPAAQVLENYEGRIGALKWLQIPSDLRARVLWKKTPQHTKKQPRASHEIFGWADLAGAPPPRTNELRIASGLEHYNPVFSPDGRSILLHREKGSQDGENCHDLVLSDLGTGRTRILQEYLFGQTEKWSMDGARLAYLRGTSISAVKAPLQVAVFDIASGKERILRQDENLRAVTWLPNGDLLASTSWLEKKDGKAQEVPLILRWKNAGGEKSIWQAYAWNPAAASYNEWVYFFGRERGENGIWLDSPSAVNIAQVNGSNRRLLAKPEGEAIELLPLAGDKVLIWSARSEALAAATLPKAQALSAQCQAVVSVIEYSAMDGSHRNVAQLSARYQLQDGVSLHDQFLSAHISPDGKYLLFLRKEHSPTLPGEIIHEVTTSWHAIRLEDGKHFPLAVFAGDNVAFYCF